MILTLTGSPAMAGLFGLVTILAITAGALPAGDLVDRFDRRTVLLVSEACRLAAVVSERAVNEVDEAGDGERSQKRVRVYLEAALVADTARAPQATGGWR